MGVTVPLPVWVRCLRVRVRVDKKTPGGHPCHTLDATNWVLKSSMTPLYTGGGMEENGMVGNLMEMDG